MIEMRMREDDCVDLLRSNRRIAPIALTPFLWPLKQAAINQDLQTVLAGSISRIDQMLRAGDGPGSAEELDVGQFRPPRTD